MSLPARRSLSFVAVLAFLAQASAFAADLRGHGGPVRAIALDSTRAATASFDTTIIRWDLARGIANEVLRFHDGAVNAVVFLPGGGLASASEDRRIAIWGQKSSLPIRVFEGHEGPVAGLTLSPDGKHLASASWDGTIRVWPLTEGTPRVIEGHRGPVNAVAYLPDGRLASAGYDGTVRLHPPEGAATIIEFGLPLNALAVAGGELIAAGADGSLRLVNPGTGTSETLELVEVPIVALAASGDGAMVAAAGFRGALVLVDRKARAVTRRLAGPAFPLWSLAFSADGRDILTGGADRLVRRWSVATGEPANPIISEASEVQLKALENHPGAEVFRACVACHSLSANDGNRAGPTLGGVMGRRIATAPGYAYSPALGKLDITWSRETIARLFEVGPMAYTPGTKMPEQTINSADDREALVDFLDKATR